MMKEQVMAEGSRRQSVDERILRHYEHNLMVTEDMQPGDMIEFKRGWYSHWGVCVGDHQIVHLTGANDGMGEGKFQISGLSVASAGGMSHQTQTAEVQMHDFWDIVKSSKAIINNNKDKKCTPLHPEMIVQAAISKIGDIGYNMLYYNCEHFAAWCRYGIGISEQAEKFLYVMGVGTAVASGVGIVLAGLARSLRNRGQRSIQHTPSHTLTDIASTEDPENPQDISTT